MADLFGVERSTIARAVAKLKLVGVLRRIGPDKGGHWQVVENFGRVKPLTAKNAKDAKI